MREAAVAGGGQGTAAPHYFRGSDHRAQIIWPTFPVHGEAICSNSYNDSAGTEVGPEPQAAATITLKCVCA